MTQQENIKELPYGVSDFLTVANENLYFVDKSMYIPKLEKEGRNLFFIRPRRFGKSIFVSMLRAYYDCKTTPEQFQKWFGDLWIGQHPTPLQGKFMVLHLDFSQVGGTIDNMEKTLMNTVEPSSITSWITTTMYIRKISSRKYMMQRMPT